MRLRPQAQSRSVTLDVVETVAWLLPSDLKSSPTTFQGLPRDGMLATDFRPSRPETEIFQASSLFLRVKEGTETTIARITNAVVLARFAVSDAFSQSRTRLIETYVRINVRNLLEWRLHVVRGLCALFRLI